MINKPKAERKLRFTRKSTINFDDQGQIREEQNKLNATINQNQCNSSKKNMDEQT